TLFVRHGATSGGVGSVRSRRSRDNVGPTADVRLYLGSGSVDEPHSRGKEGSDPSPIASRTAYLMSHSLCCCFWASCFWCLTARFSLRERPGFLAWLLGLDFSPMTSSVWSDGGRGSAYPDRRHQSGARRHRPRGRPGLSGHRVLLCGRP